MFPASTVMCRRGCDISRRAGNEIPTPYGVRSICSSKAFDLIARRWACRLLLVHSYINRALLTNPTVPYPRRVQACRRYRMTYDCTHLSSLLRVLESVLTRWLVIIMIQVPRSRLRNRRRSARFGRLQISPTRPISDKKIVRLVWLVDILH